MIPNSRLAIRLLAGVILGLVLLAAFWQKEANGRSLAYPAGSSSLESRPALLATPSEAAANCRYGVEAGQNELSWLGVLGAGWYLDFRVQDSDPTAAAEHFPSISIRQDKDANHNRLDTYTVSPALDDDPGSLGWWIDRRPGAIWILGNEPDRGPDPGGDPANRVQNDTMPEIYAQAYHEVYHFIKTRDPQALVANAGLVEVTPGRLQYLDIVWDTYLNLYGRTMPVDVWNMHLYILPEVQPNGEPNGIANVALGTDPALGKRESGGQSSMCPLDSVYCFAEHDDLSVFAEQVEAMRGWMRDHGQRNKPLILSEYSILFPEFWPDTGDPFPDEFGNTFNPQRVTDFMEASFTYLESAVDGQLGYPADGNRLLQQWLWYGIEVTGPGDGSNLVNEGALTQMGQAYKDWVAAQSLFTNLLPDPPADSIAIPAAGQTTVTATLTADVRNNGTLRAGVPFSITFYADEALSQVIDTEVVPAASADFPGLTGCATRHHSVNVSWPDLGLGWHDYWIQVDSDGDIEEGPGGELDNVTQGRVLVPSDRVHLPAILRN